jgi:hypothetical protein
MYATRRCSAADEVSSSGWLYAARLLVSSNTSPSSIAVHAATHHVLRHVLCLPLIPHLQLPHTHHRIMQLEEIKAARGLNVDDGTAAADKPLAEVLAERKKAKQDAFDEQWRQMKTGERMKKGLAADALVVSVCCGHAQQVRPAE